MEIQWELRNQELKVKGEVELPGERQKGKECEGRSPSAGVPLSPTPSQALTLRQRSFPMTHQRGLVIHVQHGVLQGRKSKQMS